MKDIWKAIIQSLCGLLLTVVGGLTSLQGGLVSLVLVVVGGFLLITSPIFREAKPE